MKKITFLLTLLSSVSLAQSNSFQSLKENFANGEDVVSISFGGFVMRTALWMMDDEEVNEWMDGIENVRQLRFINIPKEEFVKKGLKLNSFRKYVIKDGFEQLLTVKENDDHVEFFMQEGSKNKNRYLVIAEQEDEVTVFELTGFIDIEKLASRNAQRSNNSL
jgi:hypothetical protein